MSAKEMTLYTFISFERKTNKLSGKQQVAFLKQEKKNMLQKIFNNIDTGYPACLQN